MQKFNFDIAVPTTDHTAGIFLLLLKFVLETGHAIIDDLDHFHFKPEKGYARYVQEKIIGILSNDQKVLYLFPEVLTKILKEHDCPDLPPALCKKKFLRELLTREGLLIQGDGHNVEKRVLYHGIHVKIWPLDLIEIINRQNKKNQ